MTNSQGGDHTFQEFAHIILSFCFSIIWLILCRFRDLTYRLRFNHLTLHMIRNRLLHNIQDRGGYIHKLRPFDDLTP